MVFYPIRLPFDHIGLVTSCICGHFYICCCCCGYHSRSRISVVIRCVLFLFTLCMLCLCRHTHVYLASSSIFRIYCIGEGSQFVHKLTHASVNNSSSINNRSPLNTTMAKYFGQLRAIRWLLMEVKIFFYLFLVKHEPAHAERIKQRPASKRRCKKEMKQC